LPADIYSGLLFIFFDGRIGDCAVNVVHLIENKYSIHYPMRAALPLKLSHTLTRMALHSISFGIPRMDNR
jgi:hypothetical protein